MTCSRCNDTGIEPGTIVISPGSGSGFNSLDPDPLDRGNYVPCKECGDRLGNGARGQETTSVPPAG